MVSNQHNMTEECEAEEQKAGTKFLRLAMILTSVAGAVLLADILSVRYLGDHLLTPILGALVGFLAALKR
jgi:hypothetical protein